MNNLEKYGSTERYFIESTLYPEYFLGRIIAQYKDLYKVATNKGEYLAEISGKFRYETNYLCDYPAVGDFVMLNSNNDDSGNLIIHKILTRKSSFERSAVGTKNQSQIVAANIDIIFICMSLNNDYNLRRLERYLSISWNSRATPVVILTKSDLCNNITQVLNEISSVAIGTDVLITSTYDEKSHQKVLQYLKKGVSVSFIGSSGVGKSTLINCLAKKEVMSTSDIRKDDKGRHTTTTRELMILPNGGIVIDTPGMRELGLESADLSKAFADIDDLVSQCKFSDCSHKNEPNCAVRKAIECGQLDEKRFQNYLKLKKEVKYEGLSSKQIEHLKFDEMFSEFGGMKKIRSFIRQNNKRKH